VVDVEEDEVDDEEEAIGIGREIKEWS